MPPIRSRPRRSRRRIAPLSLAAALCAFPALAGDKPATPEGANALKALIAKLFPAAQAGAEPLVAEAVVEVRVGVDHPADRQAAEFSQVGTDFIGLPRRPARVHHHEPVRAADHADAHVQRVVPPLEDSVGPLVPAHGKESTRFASKRWRAGAARAPGAAAAAPAGRPRTSA